MEINGATTVMSGNGTLVGDFTVANEAAISPGTSPGNLTIEGSVTFADNGLLDIELGGTEAGSKHDFLHVIGDVTIDGGLLELSLLDNYVPNTSRSFVILKAKSITGRFANAVSSVTVGDVTLPITYRPDRIILGVVPEPSALLLVLIGSGLLPALCRSRNKN